MLHEEILSKLDTRLDSLDSDVSGDNQCHASCSRTPQSLLKSETSDMQLFYSPFDSHTMSTHPEDFNYGPGCQPPRQLVVSANQVQQPTRSEEGTSLGPIANDPSDPVSFLDC